MQKLSWVAAGCSLVVPVWLLVSCSKENARETQMPSSEIVKTEESIEKARPSAFGFVPATLQTNPPAPVRPLDPKEIFRRASPSIVVVRTYDEGGRPVALGSGFYVDDGRKIVTNFHVVDGATKVEVVSADGEVAVVDRVLNNPSGCGETQWGGTPVAQGPTQGCNQFRRQQPSRRTRSLSTGQPRRSRCVRPRSN
jgi:S1-C subfamily serine protease